MILKADDIKATYKVEVHFGRDRSVSALKPSLGMLVMWESGKRFHGGGDDKMYWCGWQDCNKPIRSSAMAQFHLVCPHCQRECFLDPESKARHVRAVKKMGGQYREFERIPIIVGEKIFRLTPRKIAQLLAKTWHSLDGDADIYVKYHRDDIRASTMSAKEIDRLDNVRAARSYVIYPLKNILKDTAAGANLEDRFLALVTA